MSRTPGSPTKVRRVTDARQRAWNAMRRFKTFTTADLEPVAEINERNLRTYLQALHRAGYLRIARPKRNGAVNGHAVWQLIRNSGPRCPLVRRDGGGVYDPNTDQLHPYALPAPGAGSGGESEEEPQPWKKIG